jgi:hypothetical protein
MQGTSEIQRHHYHLLKELSGDNAFAARLNKNEAGSAQNILVAVDGAFAGAKSRIGWLEGQIKNYRDNYTHHQIELAEREVRVLKAFLHGEHALKELDEPGELKRPALAIYRRANDLMREPHFADNSVLRTFVRGEIKPPRSMGDMMFAMEHGYSSLAERKHHAEIEIEGGRNIEENRRLVHAYTKLERIFRPE